MDEDGEEERMFGGVLVIVGVMRGVGGEEFAGDGGCTTHMLCSLLA